MREQRRLRESGERLSFAVVETRDGAPGGRLAGHVVVKRGASDSASAEVGDRGRTRAPGVAPRALRTLTDWVFASFPDDEVTRLDLLHQVDNTASCRVAGKCGYLFDTLLPAAPPAFPLDGHRHVRARGEHAAGQRELWTSC
ncbi:N-acetyltransferase OS=Streptomyces alboniger OX=132473 GN=CP975_10220 PE=4 SV=1 [Streptomyces alboniger]